MMSYVTTAQLRKLLLHGFLSDDCSFELLADRDLTSEEWDLVFEHLVIARRQADRRLPANGAVREPQIVPDGENIADASGFEGGKL